MKWGRHYLPSLARAHQLQECLNFKDPGVQHYGGRLFGTERDLADDAFNNLPAPTPAPMIPTAALRGGASHTVQIRSAVSMRTFNSSSAPCFHGDCLVHMSDGSFKAVANVTSGDRVVCNTHLLQPDNTPRFAEVECVVQTQIKTGLIDMIHFSGGLQVTPYHPISDTISGHSHWRFPADIEHGKLIETKCDAVYSFLLRKADVVGDGDGEAMADGAYNRSDCEGRAQSMVISGVPCITLAHGIVGDKVATHDFYGTEHIVDSLREVVSSLDALPISSSTLLPGRVVLQEGCVLTDPATGLACGFRLESVGSVEREKRTFLER